MTRRVTLVAGRGELVPHVAGAVRRHGDVLQVIDLVGRPSIDADEIVRTSMDAADELLGSIRAFGPSHLVFAGGVHITDAIRRAVAKAFGTSAGAVVGGLGDVGLWGQIQLYCKSQGYELVGAHEVAPDLLAPNGHIGGPPLTPERQSVAAYALNAARAIGAIDLSQAIVVSAQRPIAAEDIGGTDDLIARVAHLRKAGLTGDSGGQLVLAKVPKPGQPHFIDLPAIGPQTVIGDSDAGIGTIVVEAGATLLLDRPSIEREAVARGVAVVGMLHG